jgi:hypothetical protein
MTQSKFFFRLLNASILFKYFINIQFSFQITSASRNSSSTMAFNEPHASDIFSKNNIKSYPLPLPHVPQYEQNQSDIWSLCGADMMSSQHQLHSFGTDHQTENSTQISAPPHSTASSNQISFQINLKEFVDLFKARRIELGYSQAAVGSALRLLYGHAYSQSYISRFEAFILNFNQMVTLQQRLMEWLKVVE